MTIFCGRFYYRYAKCLILAVLGAFIVQVFFAVVLFPSEIEEQTNNSNKQSSSSRHVQVPPLRLEELDFKPACEIKSREAVSAIHRAKSQVCKQLIVNKTCLIQSGTFYPRVLPNSCLDPTKIYGRYLGCYKDDKKVRLLANFYGNYAAINTPINCLDICVQAGFPYAGVQYETECFCGDTVPPITSKISDADCNMKCPGDGTKYCGGYFTMNIYETGLTKFTPQVPESASELKGSIRIIFLLTLNGRATRQVHRLINALYRTTHYFYIHVDARQDYLHRKISLLEKQFPNIKLAPERFSTIWGGASLLTMLLTSMRDFFKLGWQWDFVINLSESDFPIKSLDDLEKYLAANKGLNFVKSHGREVQRFIKKQGLDKTFFECEAHMWRIGDRKLPRGITIDGGSDWIALSPEFVSHVVGNQDELLAGLDIVFQHTLLPAESFFHTVLRNSVFCNTYVDNNLHVTNWKRKLGCKCQYKHVVDWCGCSPNDFRTEDWSRIQNTVDKQTFFARKFEPIINQEIITRVEQFIGYSDHYRVSNLDAYWQNLYDIEDLTASSDDLLLTHAGSIVRHYTKLLLEEDCVIETGEVVEINTYNYADVYKGNLILYRALLSNSVEVLVETWYKPKRNLDLNFENKFSSYVKIFKVSSEYDQKEQTFRNLGGILGPFSEPVLMFQFSQSDKLMGNLTVIWLDPAGVIADVNEIYLEENNLTNCVKPHLKTPLLPGVWKLGLFNKNSNMIALTKFLITPLEYFSGKELSYQEARIVHGGSQSFYKKYTNVKAKDFLPNEEQSVLLEKVSNANMQRTNFDLREWIDNLSLSFYNILGSCILSTNSELKDSLKCGRHKFQNCISTEWSSLAPDPKGTIGKLNAKTGRLDRV